MIGTCFVATAPVTYVEPILDDGSGPLYHAVAVLWIVARDRDAAARLAIRTWRRRDRVRQLPRDARPDFLSESDRNPFGAVTVEVEQVQREEIDGVVERGVQRWLS